jgi:hypothetical protein
VRELLWQFLLPLHLDDSAMYGLIVSQAYNGTDRGLAALARREHRTSLDALSPSKRRAPLPSSRVPTCCGTTGGWKRAPSGCWPAPDTPVEYR